MIHARIISVENPTASHPEAVLSSHLHPKFVRRRQHVENILLPQTKSFGFKSAEIFPAITALDFSINTDNTLIFKDHALNAGTSWSLGCDLSHFSLYLLCLAVNDTMLILEDDALLPPENVLNTVEAIHYYDSIPDNGNILYLQSQIPYKEIGCHDFPEHTHLLTDGPLIKLSRCDDMSGGAAYCIKPISARNLLKRIYDTSVQCSDGNMHSAFKENRIGVLVQKNFKKGYMLNDHWAAWNH